MSILFTIFTAIMLFIFFVSLGVAIYPNATGILPSVYVYGLAIFFVGFIFFGVINDGK